MISATIPRHSRLAIDDLTPNNINQLRRLNSVIFPIKYKDQYYKDALAAGEYCKLGYFNDVAVGCVVSRYTRKFIFNV